MARVAVTISLSDDVARRIGGAVSSSQDVAGACAAGSDRLGGGGRVGEQGDRRSSRGERGHRWRRRYAAEGLDGLYDEIGDDAIAPADAGRDAPHWSLRSMARASGHAPSTIHRIWRAFGLQPHRSETFKLSSDPFFEKVRDIGSVFGADRALVLVDEKSQIQALTVPSPSCRCAPGRRSGAATTTSATARPLSSRPSTSPRERSSANVSRAIGPESSANSSTSSRRTSLLISTSTSSWTTTGPTRPRRSATGSPNGRAGRPISHPPAPPGSTRSSAGSGC